MPEIRIIGLNSSIRHRVTEQNQLAHMIKPPIKTCTIFRILWPNVRRASVPKYLDTCAKEYVACLIYIITCMYYIK